MLNEAHAPEAVAGNNVDVNGDGTTGAWSTIEACPNKLNLNVANRWNTCATSPRTPPSVLSESTCCNQQLQPA